MPVRPIAPAEAMRTLRAVLPLRTERLLLRTLSPADLDAVRGYRNAPGQRRWTYNRDQTEAELMAWTAGGAPVFLRDGDTVYRTWHTSGRGTEQLSHSFALIDVLPWGRQEEWQDSPDGWPQRPTYSGWLDSPDVARLYGT